jgi:hypothetical protein
MNQYDRNGIIAGLVIGIPMAVANGPEKDMAWHVSYAFGVILFCWAIARIVRWWRK